MGIVLLSFRGMVFKMRSCLMLNCLSLFRWKHVSSFWKPIGFFHMLWIQKFYHNILWFFSSVFLSRILKVFVFLKEIFSCYYLFPSSLPFCYVDNSYLLFSYTLSFCFYCYYLREILNLIYQITNSVFYNAHPAHSLYLYHSFHFSQLFFILWFSLLLVACAYFMDQVFCQISSNTLIRIKNFPDF